MHSCSGKFVIRQGDWLLIDAPTGDDNGKRGEPDWLKQKRGYQADFQPGQLFNVHNDLAQKHNLYAQHPEIVDGLKKLLEKYKSEGRSAPLP